MNKILKIILFFFIFHCFFCNISRAKCAKQKIIINGKIEGILDNNYKISILINPIKLKNEVNTKVKGSIFIVNIWFDPTVPNAINCLCVRHPRKITIFLNRNNKILDKIELKFPKDFKDIGDRYIPIRTIKLLERKHQ